MEELKKELKSLKKKVKKKYNKDISKHGVLSKKYIKLLKKYNKLQQKIDLNILADTLKKERPDLFEVNVVAPNNIEIGDNSSADFIVNIATDEFIIERITKNLKSTAHEPITNKLLEKLNDKVEEIKIEDYTSNYKNIKFKDINHSKDLIKENNKIISLNEEINKNERKKEVRDLAIELLDAGYYLKLDLPEFNSTNINNNLYIEICEELDRGNPIILYHFNCNRETTIKITSLND